MEISVLIKIILIFILLCFSAFFLDQRQRSFPWVLLNYLSLKMLSADERSIGNVRIQINNK